MTDLFTPMNLHGLHLPNRIWMSAMTRTRASDDSVPTILMAQYYAERADAGLIVTDARLSPNRLRASLTLLASGGRIRSLAGGG